MIKSFWAVFPLLLVMALDSTCTLLGQPAAYWQGSLTSIHEFHPMLSWLLGQGPKAFLLGMGAGVGITIVLVAVLPGMLGQTLYAVAALWHGFRAFGRLSAEGPHLFSALGNHLSGACRDCAQSLAGKAGIGHTASFTMILLISVVTVLSWRWAGLLPATKAKPGGKSDKKDKKKEKD